MFIRRPTGSYSGSMKNKDLEAEQLERQGIRNLRKLRQINVA